MKLDDGGWMLEAGGWRLEAGGWRLEIAVRAPGFKAVVFSLVEALAKPVWICLPRYF